MNPDHLSNLVRAQQQAAETAKMCENFLTRYRTMMGPVNDVSELRAAGSQDLLSIRFGILKGVRDDETKKATAIWQQLTTAKKDDHVNM